MVKSIVMHQLDYNYIAACEEWYYRSHGPQIARRYGPWLERFESYRPVPLPPYLDTDRLGYTNWLTTVGYWREIPEEGLKGDMALSTPKVNARNFSAFCAPQYEDDVKGAEFAPEEKACLRLVLLTQYPEGTNVTDAEKEIRTGLLARIASSDAVYRVISTPVCQQEIHLPGVWKPEQMKQLMENGNPSDHQWHRLTQLWFETFEDVRAFLKDAETFRKPSWAETEVFPYLKGYEHVVSTFLLERPAFDWMREWNVYR